MKWYILWILSILAWALWRGTLPLLLIALGMYIMAGPLFSDSK